MLGTEVPIKVMNFDWHGNMGNLTEEKAVEGFWAFMEEMLKSTGIASGSMIPTQATEASQHRQQGQQAAGPQRQAGGQAAASVGNGAAAAAAAAPTTPWGSGWRMQWQSQQKGVLRINCADSLDRTNAASCFGMLPALQEGLRLIGVQLDVGSTAPATAALLRSRQTTHSSHSSISGAQDLLPAGQDDLPPVSAGACLLQERKGGYSRRVGGVVEAEALACWPCWPGAPLMPGGGGCLRSHSQVSHIHPVFLSDYSSCVIVSHCG